MLYQETVDANTLALIREFMKRPELESFRLVGGTALSLQIGHRTSTDIDLFTIEKQYDFALLQDVLLSDFTLESKTVNRIGLFCYIKNIKCDFVKNHGVWLDEPLVNDGIRMATCKEIAAMEIAAMAGRGRKRDFFDLFELLNIFSLTEMLQFYHQKFPGSDELIPIRSLIYFEDAEEDNLLKNVKNFNWQQIKTRITDEVKKL